MKLNEDKCHLLVAGHAYETLWANIGETRIWESKNEKLLGLTIDRNLNDHIFTFCKKAGRKLSALSRISNYMSFVKKKNYFKSICGIAVRVLPINLDMFNSRKDNSKIKILYKDNISSIEELVKKDKSFCIHHRNIQSLAIVNFLR